MSVETACMVVTPRPLAQTPRDLTAVLVIYLFTEMEKLDANTLVSQ